MSDAVERLRVAGVAAAHVDVRWLRRLAPPERFDDLVAQRATRRPLQHVLGTAAFRHLDLLCDGRALVPRPETEVTAGVAIEALGAGGRLLDVGTGSGCIALSVAHEVAAVEVVATDVSPDALALAAENAARVGLSIDLRQGDLFAPLAPGETFDVIVSNPPYVAEREVEGLEPEVKDHDPRLALVAGPTGLEVLARLVAEGPAHLRAGGVLVLEIAPHQAAWGAGHGEVRPDLAGRPRVLVVRRR